jgi:ribosomal-protein-alanine N-acetyltransferase
MWTPNPILRPVSSLQREIDLTVLGALQLLHAAFGGQAELHHVGSTALLPLLTGGPVDILVRGNRGALKAMRSTVDALETLQDLPLPVSVVIEDRKATSSRLRVRSAFVADPLLMGEYRALQRAHAHTPGPRYGQAKRRFFETLLASSETPSASAEANGHYPPFRIEMSTDRLQLVSPLSIDAAEFARYKRDNQEFHQAFGSQDPKYFEPSFWHRGFAEEALARLRKEALTFLVRRLDTKALIGACHFSGFLAGRYQHCSVGFNVAQAEQGNGFMTEALTAAIDYVCEHWGVHRVEAFYEAENTKSAQLLQRLGFRVEGVLASYLLLRGTWRDCTLAALHR